MQPDAGRAFFFEHRILTPQGERYVEERGQVSFDEQGRAIQMFGTTLDVTERKMAQLELERHQRNLESLIQERTAELRKANEDLSSFSYSISHDLRAPLRSMSSFSKILLEDYQDQLDETAKDYLTRITRGAIRMGQLIDNLLELTKISRQKLKRKEVNLTGIAGEILEQLRINEPARVVDVRIEQGITAKGDEQLLTLLLQNLLGNAWKYTGKCQSASIRFFTTKPDNKTTYVIEDNGAGFNMSYADKLFLPFQRLHKLDEFEGNGIGLAIVKNIVSRHGGQIRAESIPGQGATFYFTLE